MNTPRTDRSPLVFIVAAFATVYLVWGSTYLAIRFAIETVPPFIMTSARFLIAGTILYPFAARASKEPITLRHWRTAGLAGTLMLCGGTGLVAWSEQFIPSAAASLLVATVPFWFITLDWLVFGGSRPTLLVTLGLLGGLFGVFLLADPGELAGKSLDPRGAIGVMCACVFWAFGSLYSRSASLPSSAFVTSAIGMIVAGVVSVALGVVLGNWDGFSLAAVSLKSALAVLYLVFAGSILAFSAYAWLLRATSPAKVSSYAYVNPVVAAVLGVTLGDEELGGWKWVGAAVIVGSVALITAVRRPARTTDAASQPSAGTADGGGACAADSNGADSDCDDGAFCCPPGKASTA